MTYSLNAGTINGYFNDASIGEFLEKNVEKLEGNILDIGCGKMRHKKTVLSGKHVKKYIGLDLEPGKFSYSVQADLYWDGQHIPLENNSIGGALLFEVLEHCSNPAQVIQEAYRVLKPGGVILFSTPFLYQLHGNPFDFTRPTPFFLQKLFSDSGFSRVDIQPSGMWDTSLGQMIAIWIAHRPMPSLVRKILRRVFVPIFRTLIFLDKKQLKKSSGAWRENDMIPGILGIAHK